jgi:hypothetical protein
MLGGPRILAHGAVGFIPGSVESWRWTAIVTVGGVCFVGFGSYDPCNGFCQTIVV